MLEQFKVNISEMVDVELQRRIKEKQDKVKVIPTDSAKKKAILTKEMQNQCMSKSVVDAIFPEPDFIVSYVEDDDWDYNGKKLKVNELFWINNEMNFGTYAYHSTDEEDCYYFGNFKIVKRGKTGKEIVDYPGDYNMNKDKFKEKLEHYIVESILLGE